MFVRKFQGCPSVQTDCKINIFMSLFKMTTDSQPCRFPPDNIVQAALNADAKMSRNHIFVGRRLFFAKKYVLFLQLRFN